MLISHHRQIDRTRKLRFLGELEAAGGTANTLYLPSGLSLAEIQKALKNMPEQAQLASDLPDLAAKSKTGCVLFWGQSQKCLIVPPFPIAEQRLSTGYDIHPLRSLMEKNLMIALVLVRLGDYAIGVFRGEERLSSKVGTGLVHGSHRQGGSSAQRFERHREKQMEMFFTRVCTHAREHLEPHAKEIDYVVYGGEHFTLLKFRKQCRFLKTFNDRTLGSTLNIRTPRQATLEEAIAEVWSSNLTEWIENP